MTTIGTTTASQIPTAAVAAAAAVIAVLTLVDTEAVHY